MLARSRALALTLLTLLAAAGCSSGDLLASRDLIEVEAGFRTDAGTYKQSTAQGGVVASIRVSLQNRFGTDLLPVPCTEESPEWTLERRNGEVWDAVATGSCLLAQWALVTVSPGASYTGVVRLRTAVEPGTYRLVLGLLEVDGESTRPVVDGRARTNTFLLTD